MTDTDKQAAFLAALRKKAEEIAAKNPGPARNDRTKVMRAVIEQSRYIRTIRYLYQRTGLASRPGSVPLRSTPFGKIPNRPRIEIKIRKS